MTTTELPLTRDHYNNQSLFSDHYLDHKLYLGEMWKRAYPEAQEFLAWMRDLYAQEKAQLADYNESQLEDKWFKPIFERLGHVWEGQAVIPGLKKGGVKKPDFVFFPDEDARKTAVSLQNSTDYANAALAIGEVKAWQVSLDKNRADAPVFDKGNPMFQLWNYLVFTKVEWGILSNGRQWRLLYREEAHYLDNYFEIDLFNMLEQPHEEAKISATYFWLFFNQASFRADADRGTFLQRTFTQAQAYRRELEDDLRGNAYRALEQLIVGFFNSNATLDIHNADHRADVYRNSLYLLYRLLFLFYGESRALLPVNDAAYQERYSLQKIVKQLNRNSKTYLPIDKLPPTGQYYWKCLHETFRLISGIDAQLNQFLDVPRYNGGLFNARQHPFLEEHLIGDRHLVQAIDYLATRRITAQGGKPTYEMVDYATLDVRQLGSIYEGLLEYKVAVAEEEMVTVTRKGVETWVPLAQKGRAKTYGNRRQRGELYLITDKGERKATGSYYTPDYIVKYIVENSLSPLVEQAQARTVNGAFADEILRLNVLDPAMGSGHFLVEAMNYLAREIVAHQPPSAAQLPGDSDLLYWKRRVVESCIYGVDKNPMAVELAKLSLWLKTAVADKPLSFLDHHLQHGDSLIGATLKDLETLPTSNAKPSPSDLQSPLIDESVFTRDVGLAVGGMMAIERATTDTIEDVHLKEKLWAELQQKHVKAWRLLADVWVSTFFGNSMSREEYRALADRLQGRDSLMSDAQAEALLNHPAVTDNDYFHWQFMFPEVFFDKYGNSLKEAEGFDTVIGNPPWGGEIDSATYAYLKKMYFELHQRLPDTMKYFFGLAHKNLKNGGMLGQILTNVVLFAHEYTNLRRVLFENYAARNIINLGDGIFPEVTAPSCIIIAEKTQVNDSAIDIQDLRVIARSESLLDNLTPVMIKQALLKEIPNYTVVGDSFGLQLLSQLYKQSQQVIHLASQISLGVHTGNNTAFILTQEESQQKMIEGDIQWSLLTGRDIDRYSIPEKTPQIILYVEWDTDASSHPYTIRHLENFKEKLMQRREAKQGKMPWYSLHWARNRQLYESPKIICRQTADNLIVTVDPYSHCALNSTIIIKPDSPNWSPYFWASVLNSKLIHFVYSLITQEDGRTFAEVKPVNLRKLPIKNIHFLTPTPQRTAVSQQFHTLHQQADHPALLALVTAELTAGRNDTIHDLLAFLAEEMIRLNKEKQTETGGFLDWLADYTELPLNQWKLKTIARAYYSKGWDEFRRALKKNKGKMAVDVNGRYSLNKMKGEYEASVSKLSPLLAAIQSTDHLIDQIVYQLYGLTDEEIAIVEA